MKTSLKIEENLGYTGNSDAKSRRDHALSIMVMTVASIIAQAATRDECLHTTKYQEQDDGLMNFLWNQHLFREMFGADKTAFHILEVGDTFVLRINVSRDKRPVCRVELMFGLKNSLGDRHFTGSVVRLNV